MFVPYCTGDIHLGDADHDYGDGLVVHHKGYVNAKAGLDYLVENYADASEVFVTGSSAGGVPAPLFAGLASDELPDAEIAALADASGAYPDNPPVNEAIGSLWGTYNNVPDWPETEGLEPRDYSIPGLFVQRRPARPRPPLRPLRRRLRRDPAAVLDPVGHQRRRPLRHHPGQRGRHRGRRACRSASYIAPGTDHTILGDDALYDLEVEGTSFLDWLTGFVDGETLDDVVCTDCENPADA